MTTSDEKKIAPENWTLKYKLNSGVETVVLDLPTLSTAMKHLQYLQRSHWPFTIEYIEMTQNKDQTLVRENIRQRLENRND